MSSSEPDSSSGTVPSLFTAGISEDDAQARATSSITITVAMRVRARAAVGLGDVHRVQVGLGQRVEHVLGNSRGLVDLGGPRRDLVVGQVTDGLAERLMLLGERERGKVRLMTR